jgi:hypothetical protein
VRAPTSDIERGVWPGEPLHGVACDRCSRCARQGSQLVKRVIRVPQVVRTGNLDRDQKRALWALFVFE